MRVEEGGLEGDLVEKGGMGGVKEEWEDEVVKAGTLLERSRCHKLSPRAPSSRDGSMHT